MTFAAGRDPVVTFCPSFRASLNAAVREPWPPLTLVPPPAAQLDVAQDEHGEHAGQHAAKHGRDGVGVDHQRADDVEHRDHRANREVPRDYSHSIVPGGLLVMSSTTRLTSRISLIIREAMRSSRSYGSRAQSAVMASSDVTARMATT